MRTPAVFAICLLLAATIAAQEKKIKRSDLPPAVEKTVAAQSQGATLRGFSEEQENGQTCYEAKLLVGNHKKDILIDANGAIVEVEEEVAADTLPQEVRDGLNAQASGGKLLKVEAITKHDKLVAYEARVLKGGKKTEVEVGPDGKPLDHGE
jgi:uncharacterized membrane protein YkoI